jgi:hypothetical protein
MEVSKGVPKDIMDYLEDILNRLGDIESNLQELLEEEDLDEGSLDSLDEEDSDYIPEKPSTPDVIPTKDTENHGENQKGILTRKRARL